MPVDRLTRALIVLLVILCLLAGTIGAVAWAYFRYPNHPIFVFLSGATATPTPTQSPPITRTPLPTRTPSPTSRPAPSPTQTFTATPRPRPTRSPSPTPTPEPAVLLPPEAVPLSRGVPLPMDLYFIRDGGLGRWSEQGQLELLVAPPQQSGAPGNIRARYVTAGLPRPVGVTHYRLSPDGRCPAAPPVRRRRPGGSARPAHPGGDAGDRRTVAWGRGRRSGDGTAGILPGGGLRNKNSAPQRSPWCAKGRGREGRCSGLARHLLEKSHQPRLAAGGVVLVDDALLGRLVQRAVCPADCLLSLLRPTGEDSQAGLFDHRPSAGAEHLVAQPPTLVFADIFDRRLRVCQRFPPGFRCGDILPQFAGFVQRVLTPPPAAPPQ